MGMFDHVRVEYPLPDPAHNSLSYQSKSLDCTLTEYVVEKDGTLTCFDQKYEFVPEEQRPYYGKPEWDENPFYKIHGSMKLISEVKRTLADYHGDLSVYTSDDNRDWIEYNLRFSEGKLTKVRRVLSCTDGTDVEI
jgi:hypothetical protein